MEKVQVWAERVCIPTYLPGKPEKSPFFLENRVYQGSSGRVYPHTVIETVSDRRTDQEYTAVFLENRFIRVMFLPELGGRVHRATDKTNGTDFVYYNQVIKPALVGLTGPWISGGIEFNWPQHHRPSTFDPVEWRIAENADGSATVYIGEIENMFRTKCVSAFTVYPETSYLEIRTQLYNPTDTPQTFLWWTNPAVAANDDTQSIFPPDVYAVMDHGKRDVSAFPIARGVYYKVDYSRGVDISRYRNIPVPTSYMAFHSDYDFVGSYDHGKRAGLLHVADHHIAPGKKQWTWGNGEFGRAWDRNLTDEDGPYVELMTGCFTDNQPDFSWLMPYEEKTFTQYFMPYRELGVVTDATKDAVVHLAPETGGARVAVYASSVRDGAHIIVEDESGVLCDEHFDLAPDHIFDRHLTASGHQLRARVLDRNGRQLIACAYAGHTEGALPERATEIGLPAEIATTEELFLFGQHIEQYRHATRDAADYYLEGLRRDPTDARINNAYGKLLMRRGLVAESLPFFEAAIRKLTIKNPNPYDGEPLFNRGAAQCLLGQTDAAYDSFYKATWNAAWQDAGFYRLAAIDAGRRQWEKALDHVRQSLSRNTRSRKAIDLHIVILAALGQTEEAVRAARAAVAADPLDAAARRELEKLTGEDTGWMRVPGMNHNEIIEYALMYTEWEQKADAAQILRSWIAAGDDYPLLHFHLANITADPAEIVRAEAAVPDGCFPHRLEDAIALEHAIRSMPDHARAAYYLGNYWYDKRQYDRAIACWEDALSIRDDLPTVHRNLSLAYYNKRHDPEAALREMERAFSMDENDARVFMELDQLRKKLRVPAAQRLEEMRRHWPLTVARDDQYLEFVTCLNAVGAYGRALDLIRSRKFHPWEGGEGKVPAQWRLSLTQLAREALRGGQAEEAVALLHQAAGSYPVSFGEGKLTGTQENDIYYLLGRAYTAQNKPDEAARCYTTASQGLSEPTSMMYYNDQPPEMIFYQGLACRALGDEAGAVSRFEKLIHYGDAHMNDEVRIGYFAVSLPDLQIFDEDLNIRNRIHRLFMKALGERGLHLAHEAQTVAELRRLDPEHIGIAVHTTEF